MRILRYLGAAAALLALAALVAGYLLLRASLPQLDGTRRLPGLSAAVHITRDARGVPTIEAANRADLAFATGFVHAQDRFFEMDLSRRLAAGELAELFPIALEHDRNARRFRFRAVAGQVMAQASATERSVVEAYTRGVNAGLAALGARPWEYWLLGSRPRPWRPEDTVLVSLAMWWDLQANGLAREILRREVNAGLGGPECGGGWKCGLRFFYPAGTSWDAPDAPAAPAPDLIAAAPIPDAAVLDVRAAHALPLAGAAATARAAEAGSNNWAVAGRLTTSGAALIANDMHLTQRVPPVWYHARLRIPPGAAGPEIDMNGVTIPGAPLLVAGSNGRIAWGFTNSYGNWLSVERLECTAVGDSALTTAAGSVPLSVVREEIRVRGRAPDQVLVKSGPAGVLLRVDAAQHSCWFGSWLAQLPAATNMKLMDFEQVSSVAAALALAPEVGIPHQNMVVGDREGHIGWTILGRIPQDTGPDRARGGAAWTSSADHPRIVDPALGRIWSANARVASDPHQQQLIGGELAPLGSQYDLGARAGQIRDDLLALGDQITPADMLRIQLDDRALFLARWRALLLELLDAQAVQGQPQRAEFRRLVEDWDARAGVDSVGYRLVRSFHDRTQQAVWDMLLAALHVPPHDNIEPPMQFEGPLWQLVTVRPPHLLADAYPDWAAFLRAQLDATSASLVTSCAQLARCSWGARNVAQIRHPLSRALNWFAWFLDMPTLELPGDHDMPRVQDGAFGASERFAVSPGHEEQGYLVIPGGQSGHPLSPYYRAGFMEWARGEALPFLPGPAEHALTLAPG